MSHKSRNHGVARFTKPPNASEIESKSVINNLDDNELGPIGCRFLANSSIVQNLSELSLNNNKIKDAGLKSLTQADLQVLEDLSLSFNSPIIDDNSLTSEGVKILERRLESLECLSLGGNKLNDASVASLSKINPGIYFLKLCKLYPTVARN